MRKMSPMGSRIVHRTVGAVTTVCGLMLVALVAQTGSALSAPPLESIPPQDDPPSVEAEASAVVRMKERCIWYVRGVPEEIELLPTGDDVGKTYDGTEFSLSADLPELLAWNSGGETGGGVGDPDEHAWCTYFGSQSGIEISGSWSAGGFTAVATSGGPDSGLDFDLTPLNPLEMAVSTGTCRTPSQGVGESAWSIGGGAFEPVPASSPPGYILSKTENGADGDLLTGILMTQPRGSTTAVPDNTPGANDRCNIVWSTRVNVPAGGKPRFAGEAYTFSGPTFTTEIAIDSGGS